jgi:hypothetical protein
MTNIDKIIFNQLVAKHTAKVAGFTICRLSRTEIQAENSSRFFKMVIEGDLGGPIIVLVFMRIEHF